MVELQWNRRGAPEYYTLAEQGSVGNNGLIFSLLAAMNEKETLLGEWKAVRRDLCALFGQKCTPTCDPEARLLNCNRACLRVTQRSYLSTDHWAHILMFLDHHREGCRATLSRQEVEERLPGIHDKYCVLVLNDRFAENGEVLGNPRSEHRLVIYNSGNVHFITALRCRYTVTPAHIVQPL